MTHQKNKALKAARMEKHSINKGAAVRCTTDFKNAKKFGAREQRNTIFQVQKGSNCQIRTP